MPDSLSSPSLAMPRVVIVLELEAAPTVRLVDCSTASDRERLADWLACDVDLAAIVFAARVAELAGPSLTARERARRLLEELAFADEPELEEGT